ncbi:hypothetical protein [Aeromonas salmonicida]|uniref:Uncharacterized protein n=1 Tax=Aeromonas salmonicida subsp. pectinolytica 34mel TaxID=1324960 RepID=T0PEK3_AERSA|nr:hypothetical protein [Aeromonas salmonicida]ATP09019.1 uncharacterized protein Asalp_18160 [Aeromonas salmonicida subsp. pectinolytica 34mel]EQC05575.1 hypothetical protein K931_04212 [Aeromonas salmonicida subsp. pectinolytica 34mel]
MIAIVLAMLKMLPVGDQDVSKGLAGKKSVREIALIPRVVVCRKTAGGRGKQEKKRPPSWRPGAR